MTYDNADNYLRLKQLLVSLQIQQLNAVITISDTDIKQVDVAEAICHLLEDIKKDFTIPYGLLRGGPIHLDLSTLSTGVQGFCCVLPQDSHECNLIKQISDPDALCETIFKYPIFNNYVAEYSANVENKNTYDCGRRLAGELIEATDLGITAIRRWSESNSDLPLAQVIMLSNMIELTDWVFSFTNDVYGVNNDDVANQVG